MVHVIDSIANSLKDDYELKPGDIRSIYDQLRQKYIDLISYKEFKSEILQGFREMGNAIVVIMLLEEHMRLKFNLSKNLIKDVIGDEEKSMLSSLSVVAKEIDAMNAVIGYNRAVYDITLLMKNVEGPKFMTDMIASLRDSANRIKKATASAAIFYRIWAAIDFVCCVPEVSGELSVREIFGDGIFLAGCSFLHASKQAMKFRSISHSLQLVNMSIRSGLCPDMEKIIDAAQKGCNLNDQWLETIEKY